MGGSTNPAPGRAVKALQPFSGPPQASLFGRKERLDAPHVALVNGISSHVLDYDDTHLKTIIHPAGPVASAVLAWAEYRPVSGAELMNALALGCEIECRMGNAVYPEHYQAGWHITGTAGVFGSAAAMGRLLHLNEQQMARALGLAATQPVGLKVQFGSDTKSFHPGRAAQNGMVSALLAQAGFTASEVAIEGFDGWGQAISTRHDWGQVVDGLGERWELALNTYKPFACGIVSHPAIDAAIQLRSANGLQPDAIQSVDLRVHPLVLNLMGKTASASGLEGKFSIFHAVAVALVTGRGGGGGVHRPRRGRPGRAGGARPRPRRDRPGDQGGSGGHDRDNGRRPHPAQVHRARRRQPGPADVGRAVRGQVLRPRRGGAATRPDQAADGFVLGGLGLARRRRDRAGGGCGIG